MNANPAGGQRGRLLAALALALSMSGVIGAADSADAGSPGQPRVDIYTSEWCSFCRALRVYLDARGIVYTEHNVNATLATREAFRKMGGQGVPVIVVGERLIQGFDPVRIEAALDAGE